LYKPNGIVSGMIDPYYKTPIVTPYLFHTGSFRMSNPPWPTPPVYYTPDYANAQGYYVAPTIAVGDVNNDGIEEITVSSDYNYDVTSTMVIHEMRYYTYNPVNGGLIKSFSYNDPNNNFRFIGLGDFQGDGKCELAALADDIGSDTWMYSFDPLTGNRINGGAMPENCWRIACEDVDNNYFGLGMSSIKNLALSVATFESPLLISPEKDKQNVTSIRPAFEWKHRRVSTTDYKIDIAKNDTFSIAHQTFLKSAIAGSPDKTDADLYYFNYAIHEFDPGLDKDTYYWKVTALSTTESATSEVWSFRIQPDLTLTGVTNFPNPFNPNREKTKIRYRLSTDADEVKIRIYDITGSLVTELDGTTIGETSSVWDKYNDIEWDGRNGRGDLVMNGIYPFEITARLGDKTLSGRGKVAVLK
jgi:hypothetical protein